MMERIVPVTISRHKERAISIGDVVDSINVVLQSFGGRQVLNDVWIADSRLYMDLHEAVSSSCLHQGITNLPGMSAVLLKNCLVT
jgi:hypothetical protein